MSDALSFTRTQLAQMLGVTVPSISTAIDEGAPGVRETGGRGKGSKIDGCAFIQWYLERERTRARSEAGGKKLSEIERELDIELKREKLMRDRQESVPRTAFVNTVRDVMTRLNIVINQLPEREAETVIGLRDRDMAVEALRLIGDGLKGELRTADMWMPPEQPQLELSA